MMKNIMHNLFLSCLKATELIEKRFQIELNFKEKLQLKVHTAMCSACAKYVKQSEVLDKGLKKFQIENLDQNEITELKEEIIKSLH